VAPDISSTLFFAAATLFGVLGAILMVAGFAALWRARPLSFAVRTLSGLLVLSLGALAGSIAIGLHGYRMLSREEFVAGIAVTPVAKQRFRAELRIDGRKLTYELAGDELYVDAHILKWKPLANLFGLHTAYELDRIGGRYRKIEDERAMPRTLYGLAPERLIDLFDLRKRHAFLHPLLDAEYGSATFTTVDKPMELELRISTSGLLLRESQVPGVRSQ
jgi:hypothetical protein